MNTVQFKIHKDDKTITYVISVVGNEKLDTKIEIRPKLDTIIRNLTDE